MMEDHLAGLLTSFCEGKDGILFSVLSSVILYVSDATEDILTLIQLPPNLIFVDSRSLARSLWPFRALSNDFHSGTNSSGVGNSYLPAHL